MARIRAVLFDIDGTLLDSNDAHAHAWLDALRGHGKDVPFEHIRRRIGMGSDKLLRDLVGIDRESVEGRSIAERRIAILKAHYVPDLGPLPGARALVDRLHSRGITCAAVTSASNDELVELLRAAAVADLMDVRITSDDVDRTKPDADSVQVALERLGLPAQNVMLIGDTPYDIAAAAHAGVGAIAFRSGGWKDRDLEGAVAIYDGPADLATQLDDSPLFRGDDSVMPPRSVRGRRTAMRGM